MRPHRPRKVTVFAFSRHALHAAYAAYNNIQNRCISSAADGVSSSLLSAFQEVNDLNTDPQSPLDEGLRSLQSGDYQSAQNQLQRAVALNPSDGRAFGYLGVTQCRLGDLTGGIRSLQEAARLQPAEAAAQYNLAVAQTQAGRNDEARGAFTEALRI